VKSSTTITHFRHSQAYRQYCTSVIQTFHSSYKPSSTRHSNGMLLQKSARENHLLVLTSGENQDITN